MMMMMMMEVEEARVLLGFLPNSRPTLSQVKEAYKKKVWETHPDRFPTHEKDFVSLHTSAVWCKTGRRSRRYILFSSSENRSPEDTGREKYHAFIGVPFLFIVLGTVVLGGSNATRAYTRQKEAHPSHNPFLP